MTPQPSEQPTPWTPSGKALLDLLYEEDSSFTAREVLHAILAIEAEAAAPDPVADPAPLEVNRPHIVCLCGSTRFAEQMNREAELLTLGGCIVVRPEVVAYSRDRDQQFVAPEVKAALDELHLRKIDLADSVLVVNVDGYIGDSTRREIVYAEAHGKPVEYSYARDAQEPEPAAYQSPGWFLPGEMPISAQEPPIARLEGQPVAEEPSDA